MVMDDGKVRVELKHLGVAHTYGDGWAWMPKERILFSGDACVNGPFNYTGDGNIGEWIKTLENAKRLNPKTVVPGHGPVGDGSLIDDQRAFFVELQKQGRMLLDAHKSPAEAQAQVARVKAAMQGNARIRKFVGDFFPAQIEKAYVEAGGKAFPMKAAAGAARLHASDHRLNLLQLGPPSSWRTRTAKR
jgi:glyoxylase-like metal-dependent hydrolase (beta-lactamase superfamily II)